MAFYRRDIDGLRAVAVVAVVLYHAGVRPLSGGFVGVDVFFVISGFLITTLLQSEVDRGQFSILAFYERRARRLFPALFAMLAVVSVAAFALFLPEDLRRYGRSLFSTAIFASNFNFLSETGYFNTGSPEKPLLHTWSLAVEEQFYIAWPVLLYALHRASKTRVPAVAALAIASLALCIWLTTHHRDAAFFLPITRAWELLMGALLAMGRPSFGGRLQRELASLIGMAMIVGAVVIFDTTTAFPGIAAVLPCLGTALLIAANGAGDTLVARMLSWRPVVFVGLISYSFYLWHWPILALAHYRLLQPPPLPLALLLVLASAVLATLSWRYVEQPFRRPKAKRQGSVRSLHVVAASLAAFAGAGLVMFVSGGWPARAPDVVRSLSAQTQQASIALTPCGAGVEVTSTSRADCFVGEVAGGYDVILWGDSHAAAFWPAVADAAGARNFSGREFSEPGCPPLIGARVPQPGCEAFNQQALTSISEQPGLKAVVLVGRWAYYTEGWSAGGLRPPYLADATETPRTPEEARRVLERSLDRTLSGLRQQLGPKVDIYVVGQALELSSPLPACVSRHTWWGQDANSCMHVPAQPALDHLGPSNQAVLRSAGRYGAKPVLLSERLCNGDTCAVGDAEGLYFSDFDHLTPHGAKVAAQGMTLSGGR